VERIFHFIKRTNSVLLLLLFVAVIGAVTALLWGGRESERHAIPVQGAGASSEKPIMLHVQRTETVSGAKTTMILFAVRPDSDGFVSKSYGAGETKNVLFLTGADKSPTWLFTHHKNTVLVASQLKDDESQCGRCEEKAPARGIYFEYAAEDTNKDGSINAYDHVRVALTRPDGSGFVDVLKDASQVLSYEVIEDNTLSIVYQADKSLRHARVSLTSLTTTSDKLVLDLAAKAAPK
jgi:hypothetical protein